MTTPAKPPDPTATRRAADEPPPFWARWGRIYTFLATLLVVQVLAFWLLTRWAS